MSGSSMRWIFGALVAALVGISVSATGSANAQPIPPPPPAPSQPTSTSEELADMVLDVIEHGTPAVPTRPAP